VRPLTIQIYLPFGDPQGMRRAEITTRIVQMFEVPRTELDRFFELEASGQVAVYYLFSEEDGDQTPQCYIGRTGAARERFKEHLRTKDFWSRALIAVSRTNSMTDTHAGYLEWKSIGQAADAGRYVTENGNAGSRPHTPEPLQAECEDIFETIATLLSTLGHPLMRKLATAEPKSTDIEVFCTGRGANARGIFSTDGLTVFKGSVCATQPTPSATPEYIVARRQVLTKEGVLAKVDNNLVFQKDHLFKSPSGAGQVVLYRTSNGWDNWKTKRGETLNDATGRSDGKKAG